MSLGVVNHAARYIPRRLTKGGHPGGSRSCWVNARRLLSMFMALIGCFPLMELFLFISISLKRQQERWRLVPTRSLLLSLSLACASSL